MLSRGRSIAAIAALALLMPATARALPDPVKQPRSFADPPVDTRPKFRWWWGDPPFDPKEMASEVDGFAAAGFGGAEIAFGEALSAGPGWATAEQRQALAAALGAAQRDGIRLDMTIGAAWPITTPNTRPGSGLSEQELMYGRRDLAGPSTYVGPPPNALDDPTGAQKGGKLVAVTAARVVAEGDPVVQAGTPPHQSTVLDPASLVDLTSKVDSSGLVHFDVPSGHWILFGFWQRDSSEGVMDHLSRASLNAVTSYVDANQIGPEAGGLLPAAGGQFFEDSLEIDANELFWTGAFPQEFRRRRGYDMTKYLPLMFVEGEDHYWVPDKRPPPDFVTPDATSERALHDYDETLTDLYVDDHMAGFAAWARSHGMRYRTQPAFGDAFDVTRSAREVDRMGGIADDESLNAGDTAPFDESNSNWRFAMDHYRSVAGGAHQAGATEVSSELGAVFVRERMMGLGDYKAIMDKQWAFGLTRPIIHGYAYQLPGAAWPGTDHFSGLVADSWNAKTYPQWSMLRPLADYWARGDLVLRSGAPRTDVAVYRDGFVTTAATSVGIANSALVNQGTTALDPIEQGVDPRPTPFFAGADLEHAGYTYEYLDPAGLREPQAQGDGVLYPDGPRYRALVLDERALPGADAEALDRAVRHGLAVVVVGTPPSRGTSLADAAGEDRRVRAAMADLLDSPRVRRVGSDAGVLGALRDLGVEPAARWSKPSDVYSQWRAGDGTDYVYLWNASDRPVRFTGSFRTGGAPSQLDLWTGAIAPVAVWRAAGDRVEVPLELPARGTTVLAFRHGAAGAHAVSTDAAEAVSDGRTLELRDTDGARHTATLDDGTTRTATLPAMPEALTASGWHLHVDEAGPGTPATHDLDLAALADWRSIPELSGASGTGTYTGHVDVPASWLSADRGVELDLGAVDGALQASVNGTRVAPDVVADRRFDVTALLHPGANEVRVVVTTTLKNRVEAQCRSGDASQGLLCAQPATQPYGLLGPVRLVPYGRARFALPRRCSSRRRFSIHVRAPRGFHVRAATLRIGARARRVKVRRRGRRLTVVVDLRGAPRRTARVRLTIRGRGRRVVRTTRVYRPCTTTKKGRR